MNATRLEQHLELVTTTLPDTQPPIDLLVERAKRPLANALRAAINRGVARPALFVVKPDRFAGLAFAREMYGGRHLDAAHASAPIVGCDSRNVVACALLAVDPEACRWLLGVDYDEATEVPVVALETTCRVVTISRDELLRGAP